jgi:hypothetical protein
MRKNVKIVKREEVEQQRRVRPVVIKRLLVDEKRELMRRVAEINRQLRTVEA